jgi:hypothetical protein
MVCRNVFFCRPSSHGNDSGVSDFLCLIFIYIYIAEFYFASLPNCIFTYNFIFYLKSRHPAQNDILPEANCHGMVWRQPCYHLLFCVCLSLSLDHFPAHCSEVVIIYWCLVKTKYYYQREWHVCGYISLYLFWLSQHQLI